MDRIPAMQIFMRVAVAGSFVRAAETPSLPLSTVTSSIKSLEKYLQVRLLNRTTRRVSLIPEGLQYRARCREFRQQSAGLQRFSLPHSSDTPVRHENIFGVEPVMG